MRISEKTWTEVESLAPFMPVMQFKALAQGLHGEEGEYFRDKIAEYAERVDTMPKVYEQHGTADPVAYLHYFLGGSDWYILERDTEPEQHQAFGFAILNGDLQNAELGYIPITKLTRMNVELDLYFDPRPLREVKASHGL